MYSDAYLPETLIAAGPAAKIYRGVEVATGRKVLLKLLLPETETAHPLDREKLQLLAPLLLQIKHPQAAGLITMLPTEDEFALVYEYLPGISGQNLPQERKLTLSELYALATQLLQAMLAGEHWQAPHGDLKPSNLIIAEHPAGGLFLQIQDWALTQTRAVPAPETLWFSAPERLEGKAATTASELFTAAASLFYLATGTAPVQGSTGAECLAQWQQFDPQARMSVLRPDLDSAFSQWLARLLRLDAAERPDRVRAALEALVAAVQQGDTSQQTTTLMQPPAVPATKSQEPRSAPSRTASRATPPPPKAGVLRGCLALLLNAGAVAALVWYFSPSLKDWLSLLPQQTVPWRSDAAPSPQSTLAPSVAPVGAVAVQGSGVQARYVRIALRSPGILNLAEVQIFSGEVNIAPTGRASQSSTYSRGPAHRAIDGEVEGSFTQTLSTDNQPWWELDLGEQHHITRIVLWNRTDKYAGRLQNFTISLLDTMLAPVWQTAVPVAPMPNLSMPVSP
jgi:serine/threonine protein kinase